MASTMKEKGFRFVFTGSEFKWLHPAEVHAPHVDCTDMDDDEFAEFVASHT